MSFELVDGGQDLVGTPPMEDLVRLAAERDDRHPVLGLELLDQARDGGPRVAETGASHAPGDVDGEHEFDGL